MSELNIYGAVNGNTETEYPKGDANGSASGASTIPKDDYASVEVFAGDDLHYQTMNPKVTQAIRVVIDYCAMGRGAKKRRTDARLWDIHTRAVRMTAQNVGEEDITNVRTVLGANGIHAANMMGIDVDAMGFRALRGIRMRPREQRERKDSVYPIGEGEKQKAKKMSKKKGLQGAHDGTRTHVGMSKRLDLVIKEQEGTSHQATLVIGGITFINTGTRYGYGQHTHSKGISAQPTELRL
jgi:hypothetical protein